MSYDSTVRFRRLLQGIPKAVDNIGEQALFYGETIRYVPNALTRYRKETIRNIAEMTMGTGALVMIGGTVGVAGVPDPGLRRRHRRAGLLVARQHRHRGPDGLPVRRS